MKEGQKKPHPLMAGSSQELVEKAARSDASFDERGWLEMPKADRQRYMNRARAALSAVLPDVIAAERERAAKVAEEFTGSNSYGVRVSVVPCRAIAAAIRGDA